jgi:hypothetical protein
MNKMKGCPRLMQSETRVSATVAGESFTSSYFLPCIKEKCAAYRRGHCMQFDTDAFRVTAKKGYKRDER